MKEKGDQKQFTLQEQKWCIYSPLWVREEVFLIVFVLLGVFTNALKCTWKSCLKLLQYGYCMWGKRPATICLASIAKNLGNKHTGALLTSSLTNKHSYTRTSLLIWPYFEANSLTAHYNFLWKSILFVRLSDHIMIDINQVITITITSPLDSSLRTSSWGQY